MEVTNWMVIYILDNIGVFLTHNSVEWILLGGGGGFN